MGKSVFLLILGLLTGVLSGYFLFREADRAGSIVIEENGTVGARAVDKEIASDKCDPEEGKEADPGLLIPLEKEKLSLFSEELIEYFHSRFAAAWPDFRDKKPDPLEHRKGEDRFREAVMLLPGKIAGVIAEESNDLDTLKRSIEEGFGSDLIAMADKGLYVPDPGDLDWKAVDQCMQRRIIGPDIEGTDFTADTKAEVVSGMTIHFGPGIHSLDENKLSKNRNAPFPEDVTIAGSGMDVTLLRIGNIGIKGNASRLVFQDLTLDAEDDGLFDMRTGSLVLDLNRVRVVRFDAGHGGCYIFKANGCLIRARDSQFVGGYGKSPGKGSLFRGKPVLARFIHCRFELMDLALNCASPNGRISFQGCTFALLDQDPLMNSPPNVDLYRCSTEFLLAPETTDVIQRKDLSLIFAQLEE